MKKSRVSTCSTNNTEIVELGNRIAKAVPEGWACIIIPDERGSHPFSITDKPIDHHAEVSVIAEHSLLVKCMALLLHDETFVKDVISTVLGKDAEIIPREQHTVH